MDTRDENLQGETGRSVPLTVSDANFAGDSGWSPDLEEARARRDLVLSKAKAKLIAETRRQKIAAYIWSTILFLVFSAIAFYGGFWYAMTYGVCP